MNRLTVIAILSVLVMAFSGCDSKSEPEETDTPQPVKQQTQPTPTLSPKQEIVNKLTESISKELEGFEYKISYGGNGISLNVSDVETAGKVEAVGSSGDAPDNWEDIKNKMSAVSGVLKELSVDVGAGDETCALYLRSNLEDGDIYITILNEKIMFDLFGEKAESENSSTITLEEFNKIQNGMSYQDVVNIIGGYGEVMSDSDILGDNKYRTTMYSWSGEGIIGGNASVMIQGGEVISKSQFGLE